MIDVHEATADLFGEPAKRPRLPNGLNLHRFLEGYGIQVQPYSEARSGKDRPANVIYGGRTIARLMRKDVDRTGLVIRCIQVSNPRCFDDVIIWSVWQFIVAHMALRRPTEVIDSFRGVDLSQIKKRAHRLAIGSYGRMGKTWPIISTLIADELITEDKAA